MRLCDINSTGFLVEFEKYIGQAIAKRRSTLDEQMCYAVMGGGKRVRPFCVFLGARAVDDTVALDAILPIACAVELVHSYSLVHDDLPAMDNDEYRRGKYTVHKKFGEANGILTGDMLLSVAASLLFDAAVGADINFAKASAAIFNAACDMADGQVLDLQGCKTKDEYLNMYAKKTGAMIVGAFEAGAICANANSQQLDYVRGFASHLGLAFQLADDLLDEGEERSVISAIGSDATRELLLLETQKASEFAKKLRNSRELEDFAAMLSKRKA